MSSKRKAKTRLRPNTKKRRGLTLPGYNNLGPFNDLDTPTNPSDAAAYTHDVKYGILGKRAYWTYNQADEDFLDEIKDNTDYGAKIARGVFKTKKFLAEWNLLPKDEIKKKQETTEVPISSLGLKSSSGVVTRSQAKKLRQEKINKLFKNKKKPSELVPRQQSVLNLQEDTQVPLQNMTKLGSDGKGSGVNGALSETPVDEVIDVQRGFPSYQFASLPWTGIWYGSTDSMIAQDIGFRMTSPYDCIVGTTLTDSNAGTGVQNDIQMKTDTNDIAVNSAMWFTYYSKIYRYYHVVSCKWKILFENLSHEPLWIHQMYVNDENPPIQASNIDMLNWPDCESHYVAPMCNFSDTNGVKASQLMDGWQSETKTVSANTNYIAGNVIAGKQSNILQLSGQYSPGDYNREIRLDADVENWTAVTTNPKLYERLLFRLKSENPAVQAAGTNNSTSVGRKNRFKYTIQLEYLVEFKELNTGLKWPTAQQPISELTIFAGTATSDNVDEVGLT